MLKLTNKIKIKFKYEKEGTIMKKSNFFSKSVICLVAVSMSVVLFAGCQSKAASTTAADTTKQTTTATKPSADEMKKQTQESMKTLVTAGTITQAQSDKIVEALTANRGNKSGEKKQKSDQQSTDKSKTRTSPLSKLVTDGTITQAQSDAVMAKMKENFKPKNNGQSSESSGQTSN
jgi:polyhydroxyalkanoate synthesis regulator phasin